MNDSLMKIAFCNVVIKNGSENIICLYFNERLPCAPIVIFKSSSQFIDYYIKVAQSYCISCVERKLLAKRLFEEAEEDKYVPQKYVNQIAEIYSLLPCFSSTNEVDNFNEDLKHDVFMSLGNLERHICKQAERKFFNAIKDYNSTPFNEKDVLARIEDRLESFADKCSLNLIIKDTITGRREFCIESLPMTDEPQFNFWQTLMLSTTERKIYIGSKTRLRKFEIKDAELALDYYMALFDVCNKKLGKDARRHCSEFRITSKSYDIAKNAIKTMLDSNRKNAGFEYTFNSNKIIMVICLQKNSGAQNVKSYEIAITCSEFLRNPTAFKNFIANPKRKCAWNFWCKERNFNR